MEKLLQRWRTTGSSDALSPVGVQTSMLRELETALQKMVAQQPDATLSELKTKLARQRRVSSSQTTVWRTLEMKLALS